MLRRLVPADSVLIVVDIQERLSAAMPEDQRAEVLRAARILIEAARLMEVPVLYTEQYPKGLGPTLPEVAGPLASAGAVRFEKTVFSAWKAPGLAERLGRPSAAIVLGMEAHVCVFQTVRDLRSASFEVFVPLDGVSSRRADHREVGLSLCERAGAVRTTSESIVFDWMGSSGHAAFKQLSKLIR